jgi:DNA-binding NarL/FixJ family response regulator
LDTPEYNGFLRKNVIRVPAEIEQCTGIRIFGKLLRAFVFSTDVAIIRNCNADAVISVYPFTPQPIITHSLILASDKPIFCGVGGGLTTGERALEIALDAEFQGAMGVVLNKPTPNTLIRKLKRKLEIPVVITTVAEDDDFKGRLRAGVDIFNVSGAEKTAAIIRKIRSVSQDVAILATGGRTAESITEAIEAGANAISYTPPSTGELFKAIMERYRRGEEY